MTVRADAHIHLFAGGYQGGSFTSRAGVSIDEAACYDSLAREHHVTAALVVGYGAEAWCASNNAYLAQQCLRYDWIRPVAYVDIDSVPTLEGLEILQAQGFVGISLYIFGDAAGQLARIPAEFWHWLDERRWMVSINSQDDRWAAWQPVLERSPRLRLLMSHLGLPPAATSPPSREQSAASVRHVTALAKYPDVCVKLSGFYALCAHQHDYPHEAAWPYVERLVEAFSSGRLLWGSDYSPCLDWVSFPQTYDLFSKMPFLTDNDAAQITGNNLLAMLTQE